MKTRFTHLLLPLLFLAFNANAQNFKVIEETKDYILKECDSAYYYTHGIEQKDEFEYDTTLIHLNEMVPYVLMDDGKKQAIFEYNCLQKNNPNFNVRYLVNKRSGYYLYSYTDGNKTSYELINKRNGKSERLECNKPLFSPDNLFYAYNIDCYKTGGNKVFYKNTKSKGAVGFSFFSGAPMGLKWINNYSFMFWAAPDNRENSYLNLKKYYLVKIKQ